MLAPELRLDTFGLVFTIVLVLLTLLFKLILKLNEECERPTIYQNKDGEVNKQVIKRCKKLNEIYQPPLLWGRNGHLQTMVHAATGRFGEQKTTKSKLVQLKGNDGATISYNFFHKEQNDGKENLKYDHIVLIVPGIANHSKSIYIQATARILVENGFDVAVFNHLGAHPNVKLTSPRIFTYGCTTELDVVVKDITKKNPGRRLIGIGFSLGANIMLKYLGEKPIRQQWFSFALSICQGYDLVRALPFFTEWRGLRRFYNWVISRNYKALMTKLHRKRFLEFEARSPSNRLDWRRIYSASNLQELDDAAMKRFASFNDVRDFYRWSSSQNYMKNVEIPLLLLNALDDPLIPEELLDAPRKFVEKNKEAVFVTTRHGGHLGFFEGGPIHPNKETWLDHALVEYIVLMEEAVRGCEMESPKGLKEMTTNGRCFKV